MMGIYMYVVLSVSILRSLLSCLLSCVLRLPHILPPLQKACEARVGSSVFGFLK